MTNNNSLTFFKVDEFDRDLKKLKKFNSLEEDLETFTDLLSGLWPRLPSGTVRISDLGQKVTVPVYKVKHFHCKCLNKGSRSGIRLIFAAIEDDSGIVLVEIYYKKNDGTTEDRKRIYKHFS